MTTRSFQCHDVPRGMSFALLRRQVVTFISSRQAAGGFVSQCLERRRSPRVSVEAHRGLPKGLVDVSLGGFAIALPLRLPHGSVHDVGLSFGNGRNVALRVRVAYSRQEEATQRPDIFVTGFEFVADVTNVPSRRTLQLAS
jgi:hypothetical protein